MMISNAVKTESALLANGNIHYNLISISLTLSVVIISSAGCAIIIGTARTDRTKRIAQLKLNVSLVD